LKRSDSFHSYNVNFIGWSFQLIPGDELSVTLKHIGMIAQPMTVYAFTGQGSQDPGMGMEPSDFLHVV
jgi:fatty acid synthase subunit alpha